MKFGKSLSNQIEQTLPEWRDKFLSYKELKKRLKLINPQEKSGDVCNREAKRPRLTGAGAGAGAGDGTLVDGGGMSKEEVDFVELLEKEIEKFNLFFVEKEEEYIIKLKELQDNVAKAKDSTEEMIKIRKEMVDFHGEMVLLENYSALNYTGIVKILKKYDKRTGAVLRLPYIQKVLQQPFFTTDLVYKLVKECEALLDRLFPLTEPSVDEVCGNGGANTSATMLAPSTSNCGETTTGVVGAKEFVELEFMKSLYTKSTISALQVLKEIRSRSSTVSVFSLPPMQVNILEETWNKFPVLEQLAK
ncbi:putative SPX domain-containing protein [Helianthus annuus]|uniref:SPX domain-containing protein n=1 Tax=Helianthus annuus TaxID=4232 RepID=A0A251TRU0_HELAN|nr:SPX domain-containing protein 1 [Helianthus annuus]KAF5789119.1 putative SPX domain-containing protein [Helianthus annuus]KAJ0532329.1 putative SPX domain-containing protein [Helianthus annuus]KAJ0540868.1 putative SPX domain-containing protein [Helianthus annuus]KAJ0705968.1 putative SPX domain-containing protein [Helianthus annuus]KAJ0710087.1 putative SPX domain-containing protein [Helianthus annuus]